MQRSAWADLLKCVLRPPRFNTTLARSARPPPINPSKAIAPPRAPSHPLTPLPHSLLAMQATAGMRAALPVRSLARAQRPVAARAVQLGVQRTALAPTPLVGARPRSIAGPRPVFGQGLHNAPGRRAMQRPCKSPTAGLPQPCQFAVAAASAPPPALPRRWPSPPACRACRSCPPAPCGCRPPPPALATPSRCWPPPRRRSSWAPPCPPGRRSSPWASCSSGACRMQPVGGPQPAPTLPVPAATV